MVSACRQASLGVVDIAKEGAVTDAFHALDVFTLCSTMDDLHMRPKHKNASRVGELREEEGQLQKKKMKNEEE